MVRRISILVGTALLIWGMLLPAMSWPASAQAAPDEPPPARGAGAPPPRSGDKDVRGFARVIDGDTVEVLIDGQRVGVGFIGIAAPSANTPCGQLVARTLSQLIASVGGLHLVEDNNYFLDSYKRRMYDPVAYGDRGRLLAVELVRAGYARATGEGRQATALAAAEAEAKTAKRGCLWGGSAAAMSEEARAIFGLEAQPVGQPTLDMFTPDPEPQVAAFAATLPSGFVQETVVSGLSYPTVYTTLPDGRILVANQGGVVRIIKNGTLLPTPFININDRVNYYWDHGLLGMAADANFAQNGYVYLLYTYENDPNQFEGTKTARLTRVTAVGDTADPSTETVILGKTVGSTCTAFPVGTDCLSSDSPSHSVGNVKVAADGTLFLTIGDGASFNVVDDLALRAQNRDLLAGKLLHITTSGAGIASNPFWNGDPNSNRSKVWAYGLRNPYRFGFRPGSGMPYLGDVGWDTWEEIDAAPAGGNMGWPCYEGPVVQAGYQPKQVCQDLYAQGAGAVRSPLTSWDHQGSSAAATGGAFYTGTSYPAAYQGAYFYADYAQNFIRYLTVDANDNLVSGPTGFATGVDAPVQIEMGADGSLYYLSISAGEIRRIRYTAGPTAPTLTGLSPAAATAGGPGFTLTATGTGFVAGSTVQWNGAARPTTFVSATKLTAAIPASDLAAAGTAQVTVANPAPGGTSAAQNFVISAPTNCPAGQWKAEYFANKALTGTPALTRCEAVINNDWGDGAPATGLPVDNFSVRWSGPFDFAAGDYGFSITGDDGIRLLLDGTKILDGWLDQGPTTYTATRTLTAGTHQVVVEYYEAGGGAVAQASWQALSAPTSCPAGQWKAEYFANKALTGTPALTRCEAAINNDWGGGAPATGLPADNFSVRWSGPFAFAAGSYTFSITGDDGIRLLLDGTKILDGWLDQGPTTYTATKTLTAGSHQVVVEYYEAGGGAVAQASWQAAGSPPTVTITAPTASLVYKVGDVINYAGSATASGGAAIPASGLAWQIVIHHCPGGTCHTHQFLTGAGPTGSFTVPDHGDESYFELILTATDGTGQQGTASVSINPRTVQLTLTTVPAGLDVVYGGTTYTTPKTIAVAGAGGTRTIYAPSPQTLNGTSYTFTSWSDNGAQQHDVTLGTDDVTYTANFTTGTPPPNPVPTLTGISPAAATAGGAGFTLTATGTGFVAGSTVRWNGAARSTTFVSATKLTAAIPASDLAAAGTAQVTVVSPAPGGGTSAAQAFTISAAGGACAAGQWKAEYFANKALTGTPALTRCEAAIDNDWGGGAPAPGLPADNFSVRWSGPFAFAAGSYTFSVTGDDGIRLLLDGAKILDGWKDQAPTTYTATKAVTAGSHQVVVEYYEAAEGAVAKASWKAAGANSPLMPIGATDSAAFPALALVGRVGRRRWRFSGLLSRIVGRG